MLSPFIAGEIKHVLCDHLGKVSWKPDFASCTFVLLRQQMAAVCEQVYMLGPVNPSSRSPHLGVVVGTPVPICNYLTVLLEQDNSLDDF